MGVLYGSYDDELENKVQEIIDSGEENNEEQCWYDVDFGPLGIIRVRIYVNAFLTNQSGLYPSDSQRHNLHQKRSICKKACWRSTVDGTSFRN